MGKNPKPSVSRDALAKDLREWRCTRCLTIQRPSSLSCVACAQPRAPPGATTGKFHVKPAGWTNV